MEDLNTLMERFDDSKREFDKAMAESRKATDEAILELRGFEFFDENDGMTESQRREWAAADASDMRREGK